MCFLGAIVTSNIWAMTHDGDIYPDPFSFKPERYLDEDGRLNDDDRILAYGFGTRQVVLLLKYTGVEPHVFFTTESVLGSP